MNTNLDNNENNLLELIGKCGHYLYHKKGKKGGQGKILKILSQNPGITQKELQEMMEIQSGSMSEIITKLETRGFVERTKDENDKRVTRLSMTEEGRAFVEIKKSQPKRSEKDMLEALTDEEQKQLETLLKKLSDDWSKKYIKHDNKRHHCAHGHHEHNN